MLISRNRRRLSASNKAGAGFTIVEALVAFVVLIGVISGLTMALTSSMRLNSVQKQRALAQDIVRDVISRYLKNENYNAVNPFDDPGTPPANYFGVGTQPLRQDIYKATTSSVTNNLTLYGLDYLRPDLQLLRRPYLLMEFRPIKKDATNFYDTKINVVVKISWDDGGPRTISMPAVIGKGDVTRTEQGVFKQPTPTPSNFINVSASPSASASASASPSASPSASASASASPSASPTASASTTCSATGAACGSAANCRSVCCSGNYSGSGTKLCT